MISAFPVATIPLNSEPGATPVRTAKFFGRRADGRPEFYDLGAVTNSYDASHYGTIANGSANDTGAIQACIDAAPVGSTVLIPPGGYLTTAAIIVSKQLTILAHGATLISSDPDANGAKLRITASGVKVFGLTGNGNQSDTSGTPRFEFGMIEVIGSTSIPVEDVLVADCTLINSRGCGLRIIGNVDGVEFHHNRFKNNFLNVWMEPDTSYAPRNIHGHHNRHRQNWYTGTYSGAIKCRGNGLLSLSPYGLRFHDENILTSAEMGIELFDTIKDSSVEICHIDGPTFGISIDNGENITIALNKLWRNAYCGIELANQTRHSIVKINTIDEYSSGTIRGGSRGIVSTGPSCYMNTIEGNAVRGCADSGIMIVDNHDTILRTNRVYDCNTLINEKNGDRMTIKGNDLFGPCNYHVFIDCNDKNCTDLSVTDNSLFGAAAVDNIILYAGPSGRVVTNLLVTKNDFTTATFVNKAFNISLPGGSTPNLQFYDNPHSQAFASSFVDTTTSPELTPPYRSTLQRAGMSVAAKRSIVVAPNAAEQWIKVLSMSLGAPLFMALHVEGYNTPTASPTVIGFTALICAAPYGFSANVMMLPAGDYFGSVVSEIAYNNTDSNALQEVWIKVAPTTSAVYLDLYFSDYPLSVIQSPTATTTTPTFATNSYRFVVTGDNLNYLQAPSLLVADKLKVGTGKCIRAIVTGNGSFNLGTIAANSQALFTLAVPGVVAADSIRQPVIVGFSWALSNGLVFSQAFVSADNVVTFVFQNVTAAAITYGGIDVSATVLRIIP